MINKNMIKRLKMQYLLQKKENNDIELNKDLANLSVYHENTFRLKETKLY